MNTQEIVDRFETVTVKDKKQVTKTVVDAKTKAKKEVLQKQEVEREVTVIMADDFNALVKAVFGDGKVKGAYDVRLDLWSALQETLDQPFNVPAKGRKTTRPIIDNFKKCQGTIGMVMPLLDHFVQEKIIPPGRYVIRFKRE